MSWHTIKLTPADIYFSRFIRLRDKECIRCHKSGDGEHGIIGLQCSHFFSRRKQSVRYDEQNADSLCPGCHKKWELDKNGEYKEYKIKQLGQQGFDLLELRANTPDKTIDKKLIAAYYRGEIKKLI